MANRYQIKCINKPDHNSPVEHITHVGGFESSPWRITVEQCMSMIENGGDIFFVHTGQYEAKVIVIQKSPAHRKHIRTVVDTTKLDNLLKLVECQIS